MASEFDLIARHFTWPSPGALLAVGDDAALLSPAAGAALAVSTDLLVEGTHFLAGTDPRRLGHKCLAVNLSDLAAMGARPRWFTLGLSLPAVDEAWLAAFAAGMRALAQAHGIELVGGDTTRGPLTISITVIGEVPAGEALRRDGAQAGDEVWVSGELGEAACALLALQGRAGPRAAVFARGRERLEAPRPRVALGLALRGVASAAIDVSDGLCADLGHVLERSGVGARVRVDDLPRSDALAGCRDDPAVRAAVLGGGDDYELCFTAPASRHDRVLAAGAAAGVRVSAVGEIVAGRELVLLDGHGAVVRPPRAGYEHFSDG
jgi:thiamine-monophosphate kinase